MMHIPAREFVGAMSAVGRRGLIAMLRCYFDDSGTHVGSPILLWGGVIGTPSQFTRLERRWKELLADPCEGHKPPIGKFHSVDCAHGWGEFAGYSQGERDRTRHLFRQALVAAGLRSVSYAIETAPYDRLVKGGARALYGDPNGKAFITCVIEMLKLVEKTKARIATVVFDKGQMTPALSFVLKMAEDFAAEKRCEIQYSFAGVRETVGLQAADIVATEHFWHCQQLINGNVTELHPHLKALVDATGSQGNIMREPEVRHLMARYRLRAALGRVWR